MSQRALHTFAWLAYFVIEVLRYVFFSNFENPPLILSRLALTIGIKASLFYLVYSFCAPRFAFQKRWLSFFVAVVLSFTVFLILNSVNYYVFQVYGSQKSWDYTYLLYFGLDAFVIVAIGLIAAYATRQQNQEKQLLNLRKEMSQEKLRMLQAQVNPHFLFNTLNNIYSLALHSSEKTPIAIQQLASIMRYVFEQSESTKVSLKKEVETVEDLIALACLATATGFRLKKVIVIDQPYLVMPLCILSLVENFIKHGDLSAQGFLELEIRAQNGNLKIVMSNRIADKKRGSSSHKSGLENLRNRLKLCYQDGFEMSYGTNSEKTRFQIFITIGL